MPPPRPEIAGPLPKGTEPAPPEAVTSPAAEPPRREQPGASLFTGRPICAPACPRNVPPPPCEMVSVPFVPFDPYQSLVMLSSRDIFPDNLHLARPGLLEHPRNYHKRLWRRLRWVFPGKQPKPDMYLFDGDDDDDDD